MEFPALIIAIIALVIALKTQSKVNQLQSENQILKQLVQKLQHDANPSVRTEQPNNLAVPVRPQTQPAPIRVPTPPKVPKPKTNMENIFGKNVIGVVATILMFIGVFAFGTLIFTSLTDTIKVIGMFTLSLIVIIAGLVLTKKHQTVFSNCVTGCGIGILYISIFLTHLYYGLISDVVTFVLIFLWSVAVSILSKYFKIPSLAYIALAGCVIASILAQVYVVEQQKFIEITVYHLLTFVLLILANKENTALLKLSSFASMALNTALSIEILTNAKTVFGLSPYIYLCFVLGIYNLAISILAYSHDSSNELDTVVAIVMHCINQICTVFVPLVVVITDSRIFAEWTGFMQSVLFHILSLFSIAVAYLGYHIFLKDEKKRVTMFITSEALLAGLIMFVPIELVNYDRLGSLLLIVIANLVLYRVCVQRKPEIAMPIYWSGFAFLLLDSIQSLRIVLQFENIGFLYSVVLIAISCWYMYEKYGNALHFPFLQCALINGHLLFTLMALFSKVDAGTNIALIITVCLNILLSGLSQLCAQEQHPVSKILIEITESLLAFILFWVVALSKDTHVVSSFFLSVLLIPFVLVRIKNVIDNKNAFMSVWYGIKFTFYTFATVDMFTNISDQQFIVSVLLMLLASVCIGFGFWKKLKPLRIYGLVLILSSVFKMVILDVWNQESLIRVLSLIAGALICFGISAGYSKMESKQRIE